jgi:spore maturation protein SpmB
MSNISEQNIDQNGLVVRGFVRAQLVDSDTGRIRGDSGWIKNKLTDAGLQNLANLIGGNASGYPVSYALCGSQTAAVDMTQTMVVGSMNSFKQVATATAGTSGGSYVQTFTVSFGSASQTAAANVGIVGLFRSSAAGSMYAAQTFATSQWNTNQDFNVTYQLRFATA